MEEKEGTSSFILLVVAFFALALLFLVLFIQGTITGAVVGLTITSESSIFWNDLLSDTFNRNDNTTLGQGWLEISSGDDSGESETDSIDANSSGSEQQINSDSDVKIEHNRLVFDPQSKKNRPVITNSFSAKSSGIINWSFVFNFQRTGNDKDYEFWMQLGENDSMVDPKTSDKQGVAVNLKWGGTKNNFTNHSSLGYVFGDTTTKLAIVNGGNASIQVLVSLENKTFNLSIDGIIIENNLNFDNDVTIDTVRFYTDKINQNDFNLRELDNVIISHTESNIPKLTLLSPLSDLSLSANYNVTQLLEIAVNVTDDNLLQEVNSQIIYPNGTTSTISLSLVNGTNKYNSSFIIPHLQGRYYLNFSAADEYQNVNSTQTTSFLVNSSDIDSDGIPDEVDTLRGNWRNVSIEGINNFNITIAGNEANGSFSGINELGFYDGLNLLINFSHNFSSHSLDFSRIKISVAANYILINLSQQLETGKIIYLTDNNFVNLCVKDAEISSVSGISDNCNTENETDFTLCLGNSTGITLNGISCYDEGNRIKVENLRHSAIKGTISSSSSSNGGSGGGSSSNNNRDVPVLGNAPQTENSGQIPNSDLISGADSISSDVGNQGNIDPAGTASNPGLSGAAVNRFTEKSLSPYILDGVMIVSILLIVLIVVYSIRGHPRKKKK